MMQYIKRSLLIGTISVACFAQHQVRLTGGGVIDIDGVTSATQKKYTKFQPTGKLTYDGNIALTDDLSIQARFLSQGFAGAKEDKGSYYQHKVKDLVFDGAAAVRFSKKMHDISALFEGDITPNAKGISFPLVISDGNEHMSDSLFHRNGMGTAVVYRLESDRLRLEGDALYRRLSYDRKSREKTEFYAEGDLYYHGAGALLFMERQIYAGGTYWAKNDLNDYDGYNWSRSSLDAGTALVLNKRKTQIYSRIALTDLRGDMVKANGYTTGMGNETNIRMSQRIARGLWLKADMDLMARSETMKSRWGGSVRKAWKSSSLEGGYWTTAGSLFPRQCGFLKSSVKLVDNHLEIEPAVKNYWIENNDSYRYYRTDLSMELNVRPFEELRKLTLCGGGLWRNFKDARNYSSGVELFLGVETIL